MAVYKKDSRWYTVYRLLFAKWQKEKVLDRVRYSILNGKTYISKKVIS
jgi:hypothetical protein